MLTIAWSLLHSSREKLEVAVSALRYGTTRDPPISQISPAFVRTAGLAIEKVRRDLQRDELVYMTPDVGGVGLCCSNVRVVDLGLLTNRRLSREGYAALPSIFREEKPDVVVVHGIWAEMSNIYGLKEFTENYVPAIVNGVRLFLRNDLSKVLASKAKVCAIDQADCREKATRGHRGWIYSTSEDNEYFLRFGHFLEL